MGRSSSPAPLYYYDSFAQSKGGDFRDPAAEIRLAFQTVPRSEDDQALLICQGTPLSLQIRRETWRPVMSPEGSPPPGLIHWPTM